MKLNELIEQLKTYQLTHPGMSDAEVVVRGKKNESAIESAIVLTGHSQPRVVIQMPPNMECARLLPVKKMSEF